MSCAVPNRRRSPSLLPPLPKTTPLSTSLKPTHRRIPPSARITDYASLHIHITLCAALLTCSRRSPQGTTEPLYRMCSPLRQHNSCKRRCSEKQRRPPCCATHCPRTRTNRWKRAGKTSCDQATTEARCSQEGVCRRNRKRRGGQGCSAPCLSPHCLSPHFSSEASSHAMNKSRRFPQIKTHK